MAGRSKRILAFFLVVILTAPVSWLARGGAAGVETQAYNLHLLASSADEVILQLETREYQLTPTRVDGKDFQRLQMKGAAGSAIPGSPDLPQVSTLLGVPAGGKIELEIISDQSEPLKGKYLLAPVPSPAALVDDLTPGEMTYRLDPGLYGRVVYDPPVVVRIAEDGWMHDRRIIRLTFSPFQYRAAAGELLWHSKIRVRVRFIGGLKIGQAGLTGSSDDHALAPKNPFDAILDETLINAAEAKQWPVGNPPAASVPMLRPMLSNPSYRIAIQQDGIYRMSYAQLLAAGLPVAGIDPTTFALSSQNAPVAIQVSNSDGNDHVFSSGEYILFFGQKFYGDRMAELYAAEDDQWLFFASQINDGSYITWQPHLTAGMLEKYTDTNVYWLSYGGAPGARMDIAPAAPGAAALAATHRETRHTEKSNVWKTTHFTSEDTWFWDEIMVSSPTSSVTRFYTTTLSAPASGVYSATLRGELVAVTNNDNASPDHHIQVYLNDAARSLPPVVDATWDGKSRYVFSVQVPQSRLVDGVNRLDLMVMRTAGMTTERLYFNWFDLIYDRPFVAVENSIDFASQQSGATRFQISGYTSSDLALLDITTPLTPTLLSNFSLGSGTLSFERSQPTNFRYVAAQVSDLNAAQIVYTPATDFSQPADYIFITHHDLLTATQALADYRAAQGLTVSVVDIQDLYDEFNAGIYHPLAIKNYLAYAFANWSAPPTYVLLVGDGHWNLKSYTGYDAPPIYMPPYLAWVDPWQGEVDSANLLAAVVGNDPMPDVLIGRLPVNNAAEFNNYFAKVSAYEATPLQDWQRHVLFTSDDTPDPAGPFITLTEEIIASYITPGWTADRVYLDNYTCPSPCIAAITDISNDLNNTGAVLLNYVGHGGINFWAAPQMFRISDLPLLSNGAKLPVILSMTCLDGYWLHPNLASADKSGPGLIEEMVRSSQRGAVGAFSPTGLGVSTGHDALQRGFLDSLFLDGEWHLGAAAQSAKMQLYLTGGNFDLLHTFTVFGDPALKIASPYRTASAPASASGSAAPGAVITYTLQVTNTGALADSYDIAALSVDWVVNTPGPLGPLNPGAAASFDIGVRVPANAQDNDQDDFTLQISSVGDASQVTTATITTVAHPYGVLVTPPTQAKSALQGQAATYTLDIANNGGFSDSFNINLSGNTWPAISSQLLVGPLAPGGHAAIDLTVSIPAGAVSGVQDTTLVQAISQHDATKTDSAALTTTAGPQFALTIDPLTASRPGGRGNAVIHTLTVTNAGLNSDGYQVSVSGNQWVSVPYPTTVGPLTSLQQADITITVLIPPQAAFGSSDSVHVRLTSVSAPGNYAEAVFTTIVTNYRLFLPFMKR